MDVPNPDFKSTSVARVLIFDDDQATEHKGNPEAASIFPRVATTPVATTPKAKQPKVVTPSSPHAAVTPKYIFKLAQPNFHSALEAAVSCKEWPKKGKISSTDERVLDLPHLEICPKKTNKKTCHCVELAYGATTSYQDDARALYCSLIKLTDRDEGNWLLMSFMVPRVNSNGKKTFAYKIPAFMDDGRVRIFYVCAPQFCKLFGLSTKRFYKLLK